jgi:hypothetical protein
MVFFTLYLQLIGMSDFDAALLYVSDASASPVSTSFEFCLRMRHAGCQGTGAHLVTLLLQALFLGGTAFGGLLGGWIGDIAARSYPNHGRILATQFSVVAGVPFSLVLLKASGAQPEDQFAWHVVSAWNNT